MKETFSIYVEYLTAGNWWRTIHPALCDLGRSNKKTRPACFIFDGSWPGLRLACLWGHLKGWDIHRLHFRMDHARDAQGVSLYYCVHFQDAVDLTSRIVHSFEFQDFLKDLEPSLYLKTYLAKVQLDAYDSSSPQRHTHLLHVLMMTQVASWHAARQPQLSKHISLYVNQRPWMKELTGYAQQRGVDLYSLGCLRLWFGRWAQYGAKLRKLKNIDLLKRIIKHKKYGLKLKTASTTIVDAPPVRMLAEHYGQLNLDNPECHNDIFFMNERGIRPKDVLLYFNSAAVPLNEKKYDVLRRHGIAAVALTAQSCAVDPSLVPVFKPSISMPLPPHPGPQVLSSALQDYRHLRAYWRDFFQKFQIKLYTHWTAADSKHMPMAEAMADVGGIATTYQRSYESNPYFISSCAADIIFGFSSHTETVKRASGASFNYHVTVGYPGDYRFDLLRPLAAQIRQKLFASGAKYIITFLDEDTKDDERWYFGHRIAQDNYRFWLEKLLKDPALGIILKPKVPRTLRLRLGEKVSGLLTQAQATGRCFIFDFQQGILQGAYPPAAAALASDIVIHEDLCSGTAGIECTLAGIPTVLMDFLGGRLSPLSQLGEHVIFSDWDELWQASQRYLKNPAAYPEFGNWSSYKKELDPFNDGRAAERIGQCLKWMLDDLRAGKKRQATMDDTMEKYARMWGSNMVQKSQP